MQVEPAPALPLTILSCSWSACRCQSRPARWTTSQGTFPAPQQQPGPLALQPTLSCVSTIWHLNRPLKAVRSEPVPDPPASASTEGGDASWPSLCLRLPVCFLLQCLGPAIFAHPPSRRGRTAGILLKFRSSGAGKSSPCASASCGAAAIGRS